MSLIDFRVNLASCTHDKAKEIALRVANSLLNKSDPFTFARTYSNLRNGIYLPSDFDAPNLQAGD